MQRLILLLFCLLAPLTSQAACQRILSMAPSATEILFSLGLGPQVVGVTQFDEYPEEVKKLPKAGGYTNPNFEAALRLQPDLVVLVEANQNSAPQFRELGFTVLLINQQNLEGIFQSFERIGKACQKEAEARREIAKLQAKIQNIQAKLAGRPKVKVLITLNRGDGTSGGGKCFIAGQGTYFEDLLRIAGGINAYQGGQQGYPMVGNEAILRMNPEVVLDLVPHFRDQGQTSEQMLAGWQDLSELSAMRQHRVHPIGENYFNLPGPRLILALEDMAKLLHPEVAW